MKLLLLVACLPMLVLGNRFCKENTDCEDLGSLMCMKSACDWGICGCGRDMVSKWIGSTGKFACVPLKKLGESCDTWGDGGWCGAINSYCEEGECRCINQGGHEPRWGGEACLPRQSDLAPSETYATGGIGSCAGTDLMGTGIGGMKGNDWLSGTQDANPGDLPNFLWDYTPNVCACPTGMTTIIPNMDMINPFMGKSAPICYPIAVGMMCASDDDCGMVQENNGFGGLQAGGVCGSDNMCACKNSSFVKDVTGMVCSWPLNHGDKCSWFNANSGLLNTGVCDGTKGLRCGDMCDIPLFNDGETNRTCVCDATYTTSGTSCTAASEGSTCLGDYQCKSFNKLAICVEGLCQSSASTAVVSMVTMVMALIAMVNNW